MFTFPTSFAPATWPDWKPTAAAYPTAQPECLFAAKKVGSKSSRKVDRFQRKAESPYYQGVLIVCADPEKRRVIRTGIDKAVQAGFDLRGLRIYSSPRHDKELSDNDFGSCRPDKNLIILRYGVDWPQTAAKTVQDYPAWAERTYAGGPEHLVLHEIGHYIHHKNNEAAYPIAFRPFGAATRQQITEALGHPYPGTNAGEMIAEMFAGKVGGNKLFSLTAEMLYQNHGGPFIPTQA